MVKPLFLVICNLTTSPVDVAGVILPLTLNALEGRGMKMYRTESNISICTS